MDAHYTPASVENEAQTFWDKHQSFKVSEDLSKEKFYCLAMFPYPSGQLHMGHVRNYTLADVIARYQRMQGKNVLQPTGYDAFGLPAENAARKHQLAPAAWTYDNIDAMRRQQKQLGFAYDEQRELITCKPEYYRWEQWLFLQLYSQGLVYRKNAVVNWDPIDQTVLANEQVVNGKGWRSGAPVEQREIPQWFFKITNYADELLDDLDKLNAWPEQIKTMQKNWIGRSEGMSIQFEVQNEAPLTVFTTRPDTLLGATYLAISPQHPLALQAATKVPEIATFIEQCRHVQTAEASLATLDKQGIATPLQAIHPLSGDLLPIWIANFVVMDYGTGAVMSVPAHDERDYEFAKKYQLPIKQVVIPDDESQCDVNQAAITARGRLINSGTFNGMDFDTAFDAIAKTLQTQGQGQRQTQYRLRDWGVSRQRYWGTPIPIIYCDDCGAMPVPETDLPVVLPENIEFQQSGHLLRSLDDFYQTQCPKCAKPAVRETDTFDTFVESSWYYARFACYNQHNKILDDRAKYWTPVDCYIGGIEHAVMHLLYARFFHKVLRDLNFVNSDEPFERLLPQGMVLKDGSKMSKSVGNIVDPTAMIDRFGADTVRLFIIFAAPPEQSLEWSDSGMEGAHRFLKRLWQLAYRTQTIIQQYNGRSETHRETSIDWQQCSSTHQQARFELHSLLRQARYDYERSQFNTVVSAGMKLLNLITKIADSEPDFSEPAQQHLLYHGMSILLRLLAPIVPHITHVLWRELAFSQDLINCKLPKVASDALEIDETTLVVQINGKKRGEITVPNQADEAMVLQHITQDVVLQRFIANKHIKKCILISGKLVNLVMDKT